jgi:hypothetical protein
MINEINNSVNKNNAVPFKSNDGTYYAIAKPFTETQKIEVEKDKEKKTNKLGIKVAGAGLVAGFGLFILTRGRSKGILLKLNPIYKFIDEKIHKIEPLRELKKGISASRAFFTTAAIKDVLAKKTLQKCHMGKIEEITTKIFEKYSIATTVNAYKKTSYRFNDMRDAFTIANKGLKKENLDKVNGIFNTLKSNFKSFKEDELHSRINSMKENMANIHDDVWNQTIGNIKGFFKNKTYTSFISEVLAAGAKNKWHGEVIPSKEIITLTLKDNHLNMKKLAGDIDLFAVLPNKAKMVEAREIRTKLKTNLDKYKQTGDKEAKESIISSLTKLNENVTDHNHKKLFADKIKLLSGSKPGNLQELMEIYKKDLSPEEYKKLETSVNKFTKAFHNSVDSEEKLFDKIRDLLIGSAPKDTAAIALSLGAIGFGLAKADNDDQRTSVALKAGIPALGGIVMAVYCTTKLISSGPSLVIGLISGVIINRLGVFADNKRKEYEKNPLTLNTVKQEIKKNISLE